MLVTDQILHHFQQIIV